MPGEMNVDELVDMAASPKNASERRFGVDADVMAMRVMLASAPMSVKSEALSKLAKIAVRNLVALDR